MIGLEGSLNQLESRMARLEQSAMVPTSGALSIGFDTDTGTSTVTDQLDWTANPAGWEPFSTISPIVAQPDGSISGGELSTVYGRPEAHLIGSMCVLTGVVRRKAGATPDPLAAGTRHDSAMFGLPKGWRPAHNIILPCLMGNTDPATGGVVSTAWIEIRPDFSPVEQVSGRVYYIAGTGSLAPTTGYIVLQGVFPCQIIDSVGAVVENSWDDVPSSRTWDSIGADITWNNYPGPS
jgi:hypothetical protein